MSNDSRYLVFALGNELYGTPILGVREVLEPSPVKPIPNSVSYFSGVINIRGEIVGVVDLRKRFGHPANSDIPTIAFVIFDSAVGPVGAIVDKVEMVANIAESEIERSPKVETTVSPDFLLGIGKLKDRLVSLIDFNRSLGAEDLGEIRSTRLQAV